MEEAVEAMRRGRYARGSESAFERLTDRLREYLRTRTKDHWIMFLAGLVLGILLG
jgi:hypothetical protein